MALNALWPLLAHAEPAQGGGSVIEVCTSAGMQWIAVDGKEQPPAQHSPAQHCAFCALGAGHVPFPTARILAPIQVPAAVAVGATADPAPVVARSCYSPASPRAPPLLS